MNHRCNVYAILVILQIISCQAKNWMYSKSWIEDYQARVTYGLPFQHAPTEYSMETHKIGIVQREEERYLYDGGYDYRESSTVFGSLRKIAVRNKGDKFVGHLISDEITVPKNLTHKLPSLRVDMILLEKMSDDAINFVGLLETPKNDRYSSFSSSLRNAKNNSSVSYEFALCGNYQRRDMVSIGVIQVHYDMDVELDSRVVQEAAVIDPYLFMVVVKSLTVNGTSLATCEELNVRGALFDNTVPGIYLPFTIYRKFIRTIEAHANKHDFPAEMKIWERRSRVCFEAPVDWAGIPEMRVEFFSKENEAVEVCKKVSRYDDCGEKIVACRIIIDLGHTTYSGESLVHRYYTKNSRETTHCYIFAIRKGNDEHLIFGRAAFEGVKLVFNRSRKVISFLENSCCGPRVKLRGIRETTEKMSLCLPKNLRSTMSHLDAYWLWILMGAIILAILTCLLSVPRTLNRVSVGPPTIHIFIPKAQTVICKRNCPGKSEHTTE